MPLTSPTSPRYNANLLTKELEHRWHGMLGLLKNITGAKQAQVNQVVSSQLHPLVQTQQSTLSSTPSLGSADPRALCRHVAETGETLYVPDALAETQWRHALGLSGSITAYLGVPIRRPDGEIFGVLSIVDKRTDPYTQDTLSLLEQSRDLIEAQLKLRAQANQLAHTQQELAALLTHSPANDTSQAQEGIDSVTGLMERGSFYARLQQYQSQASAAEQSLCVMMFDVDNFHQILMQHGLKAGEAILRQIAQRTHATATQTDMLWRWGEDEFLLLIPGFEQRDGCQLAEKLRTEICDRLFDIDTTAVQVTISTGVTMLGNNESIESAVLRADKLRYDGKSMGCNAVIADKNTPCKVRGMCSAGQRIACLIS